MNVDMLFIGAVGVVVGGLMLRQQFRLRRRGVRVMGTVTGIREEWISPEVGPGSCPVVRFSTQAGKEIDTTTTVETTRASRLVGQVMPVIYDPADPTLAEIDTPGRRNVMTVTGLVLLPLGVVLLVFGITA